MDEIFYRNCKVEITTEDQVVFTPPLGTPTSGPINSDEAVHRTIIRFRDHWITKYHRQCERDDFIALGLNLYWVLFPPGSEARDAFEQVCNTFLDEVVSKPNQRLRLQLVFHEAAGERLANYPWEFLYLHLSPQRKFFLAGEQSELILTRFVPEVEYIKAAEQAPVRILLVTSQPNSLENIQIDDIVAYIKELDRRDDFEVVHVHNPHYKELQSKIGNYEPHVFHFIGHGEPGRLVLKSKPGEEKRVQGRIIDEDWCDSDTVSALFNTHQPHLVFLHACNGATPASAGLKSIARDLVDRSVPAVVAMQYEIENDDAKVFAQRFYEQLSSGMPIDEAVKDGRYELGQKRMVRDKAWSSRRFGTPVVFAQSDMSIVSPRPSSGAEYCPNCGARGVRPQQKFCSSCGIDLSARRTPRCGNCGTIVTPDQKFCPNCGNKLQVSPDAATSAPAEAASPPAEGAPAPATAVPAPAPVSAEPSPARHSQFDMPSTNTPGDSSRGRLRGGEP